MKNLVYSLLAMLVLAGCSGKSKEEEKGFTVVVAPDSVWDYSRLDSIEHSLRCRSYDLYGDSDMHNRIWYEGLPDSMKLKNE